MTMENTYTYTARSADNPERVVTFTFFDRNLVVDVGALIEHVERALQAGQAEAEEEYHVQTWVKPMAISAIERGTHPFDVADVYAGSDNGGLSVTAWVRAGGLRLAPVVFNMEHVDNPGAAEAFVEELEKRKASVDRPGRFPGVLDYWVSWFVGGFSVTAVLAAWLHRKYREAKT
jgi:hypothetical protein